MNMWLISCFIIMFVVTVISIIRCHIIVKEYDKVTLDIDRIIEENLELTKKLTKVDTKNFEYDLDENKVIYKGVEIDE